MQAYLVTFFLLGLVLADRQLEIASVSEANLKAGEFRKLSGYASPSWANANSVGVKATKLDINSQNAVLDVAGFTFGNPSASNDVLFYFAYFNGDAAWTSTTIKAAASLNEFASGYSHVYSYEDHDGKPGFQFALGNDFWDCAAAAASNFDCILHNYELKTFTWSNLALTNESCPTGAGYHPDCLIYVLETVGSKDGVEVLRFTLKISSQPVLVDDYELTPDFGKIDITIKFPWTDEPANARVGLLGYAGGRATQGNFNASATVDGHSSFIWGASTGRHAYFSWDDTALVNNLNNEPVYTQLISGSSILSYNCAGCGLIEAAFYLGLKTVVGVWGGLGWQGSYVFFSWAANKPEIVYWDPQIGVAEKPISQVTGGDNSALHLVPVFHVLLAIFYALFH